MALAVQITGELSEMSLPEVLQMLTASALTGKLQITSDRRSGCVRIQNGAIVGATWKEESGLIEENGLRALGAMQVNGRGSFEFRHDEVDGDINVCFSTDMVLLEVCRITDEIERTRKDLEAIGKKGDADAVFLIDVLGDVRLGRLHDAQVEVEWGRELRRAYDRSRILAKSSGASLPEKVLFQDDYVRVLLVPLPLDALLCMVQSVEREDLVTGVEFTAIKPSCERFLAEPLLGTAPA